jgi:UDP-N-acetylglucosamine--N-acetylmuramyl-(pentapeptide) pyrophosphoryl-undecaprenol N-acetylglucosamine transferase
VTRIHYYVHGRGMGHATRTRPVVRALLARGHRVDVFAGSGAVDLLRAAGFCCEEVASLPPKPSLCTLSLLARRVASALGAIARDRPALVISDGDHPALLAAGLMRLPGIAVGHGLVFSHCVRPSWAPRLAWWREAAKARISSYPASTHVAVNFVPLPTRSARTRLARPTLELDPVDAGSCEPGEHPVVCYFRDGCAESLVALVRAASHAPVELFGCMDAASAARRINRPEFVRALASAKAVVSSAGSQLISECVALQVPIFAIHDARDDEQRINVAMLKAWQLGDGSERDASSLQRLRAFFACPPRTSRTPMTDMPDLVETMLALVDDRSDRRRSSQASDQLAAQRLGQHVLQILQRRAALAQVVARQRLSRERQPFAGSGQGEDREDVA